METYIKEIQMNGRSLTSIDSSNKIVSWLSSIITELEETDGNVIISKVDGSQIVIPVDGGLTVGDLNDRLNSYLTESEVKDLINEVKLEFDKYITEDRFRMIMGINSGSSCGDSCGGGCCGFNTCCLNFLTAFVDNRECCGGITLIDNMGNQINILENLNVQDIVETEPGTYHVTKCDEEFDIVVGDQVIDNGDGTYTVNPGDGRPSFDINHTQVIDNGDGTYTFINYDGDEFTLDLDILPTLNKWIIYDNTGNSPWYPEKNEQTSCIPVPGYGLHDFQVIDVIWSDVNEEDTPSVQTNLQHNQFTHNGALIYNGITIGTACVDVVGSAGEIFETFPYSYYPKNDYSIHGTTETPNIESDIGLGLVTVSNGIPMTDLTRTVENLNTLDDKQKLLVTKTADAVTNEVYDIWLKAHSKNYKHHVEASSLLTAYLNDKEGSVLKNVNTAMEDFIFRVGGEYNE